MVTIQNNCTCAYYQAWCYGDKFTAFSMGSWVAFITLLCSTVRNQM